MRLNILILEDDYQLIITPESDFEKGMMEIIKNGSKYESLEGSVREQNWDLCMGGYYRNFGNEKSLILRPKMIQQKEDI